MGSFLQLGYANTDIHKLDDTKPSAAWFTGNEIVNGSPEPGNMR